MALVLNVWRDHGKQLRLSTRIRVLVPRPWEATNECEDLIILETPELKRSKKSWYLMLWGVSPWRKDIGEGIVLVAVETTGHWRSSSIGSLPGTVLQVWNESTSAYETSSVPTNGRAVEAGAAQDIVLQYLHFHCLKFLRVFNFIFYATIPFWNKKVFKKLEFWKTMGLWELYYILYYDSNMRSWGKIRKERLCFNSDILAYQVDKGELCQFLLSTLYNLEKRKPHLGDFPDQIALFPYQWEIILADDDMRKATSLWVTPFLDR